MQLVPGPPRTFRVDATKLSTIAGSTKPIATYERPQSFCLCLQFAHIAIEPKLVPTCADSVTYRVHCYMPRWILVDLKEHIVVGATFIPSDHEAIQLCVSAIAHRVLQCAQFLPPEERRPLLKQRVLIVLHHGSPSQKQNVYPSFAPPV